MIDVDGSYGDRMVSLTAQRLAVVDDQELQGSRFTTALSDVVDGWLVDLFERQVGPRSDVALLAVGGYGRQDLAPYSDLDVLLVHDRASDIATVAENLWYPIWDEGTKLGHAVRTPAEALDLVRVDLDTATSLLDARHLAGDAKLAQSLIEDASQQWYRRRDSWLPELAESVRERHRRNDEVAFMLEPDLKVGRGGLRDVHALHWGARLVEGARLDEDQLAESYEVLLRARVALHRAARRSGDRLLLEQQDAVARLLSYSDADVLMADVASAARRIAWLSDMAWEGPLEERRPRRIGFRRRGSVSRPRPGVVVDASGRVELEESTPVTPQSVLAVAIVAAEHGGRISTETLVRLGTEAIDVPEPWPEELRSLFVGLLAAGKGAIRVVETLDQLGLWVPFIPEWEPGRSRPQRNAYHRFTVDRHLWEAAAEAAALAPTVSRPDLLLVGALLHDIGKPYPGDHTEVGIDLIGKIAPRMGFDDHDTEVLQAMCEHHLLLPDVATRRDLNDEDTIRSVAERVGSVQELELLTALTEADSIATGPSAWSGWKAGLVKSLADRTRFLLEGGDTSELPREFPTEDQRQALRRGTIRYEGSGDHLTVMEVDQPGLFARIAGAMSLNGLDVLEAAAHTEFGMALAVFRVVSTHTGEIDWDKVGVSVQKAVRGQLAIESRLAERIRTYSAGTSRVGPLRVVKTDVTIDNDMTSSATVIEVSARNGLGLLYQVTRALSALDLNILSAKVQTLGDDVVDSFYVVDRSGNKVVDRDHIGEVESAIRHAIGMTFAIPEEQDGR
jgi:[protein-PII] uridylyltransferase